MSQSNIIRPETEHTINGVPGCLFSLSVPPAPWVSGVFANQTWISEGRVVSGYGSGGVMHVNLRFDDNCKNGHMSFAITADVYTTESRRRRDIAAGGCMHDEIEKVFPELAPLIKWHLVSTDAPTHYLSNTLYLAGDRDCWGKRKGEAKSYKTVVYFSDRPVHHPIKEPFLDFIRSRAGTGEFKVIAITHDNKPGGYQFGPKFTLLGYGEKWHECPFDDELTAREWCNALNSGGFRFEQIPDSFGEGKERQLDAARRAAVWPEATDAELMQEPEALKAQLSARLPALLAEFRADMERIGFVYEAPART